MKIIEEEDPSLSLELFSSTIPPGAEDIAVLFIFILIFLVPVLFTLLIIVFLFIFNFFASLFPAPPPPPPPPPPTTTNTMATSSQPTPTTLPTSKLTTGRGVGRFLAVSTSIILPSHVLGPIVAGGDRGDVPLQG